MGGHAAVRWTLGRREGTLDEKEERRKIAALTAIVQTMIHEVFSGTGGKNGRELFDLQLKEDELLAMAIGNELTEEELDRAFGWGGGGLRVEPGRDFSKSRCNSCPGGPEDAGPGRVAGE